jgi:succinate-semialdehyde dehydrogenase
MSSITIHEESASSINPANGELIERFAFLDADRREAGLQQAVAGFGAWRAIDVAKRAAIIGRMAVVLRADAERLARTITLEMGKPILQARGEVEKCAKLCDWYAANGAAMLRDEPAPVGSGSAYISFLPLGVVLAVMPWNFPLWQVMRAAIPILLAGNGFLLKHAPNVLRSAHNLAEAFEAAGLPSGAFQCFDIAHTHVAEVIADSRIAAVTLTGSVRAGAAVACEAARHIKKSVLELGGSDPFIILADADLDRAVAAAVEARFQNAGQVCIAAKRFIVESPIAEEFTRKFVAAASALKVGDPFDEATYIGPMARRDLRDELARQVEQSVAQGARLLLGGTTTGHANGAYFSPTVLGSVQPGMAAFDQETFGPLAAITVASDVEDAVRLANTSAFGLSGAVWTRDLALAQRVARRLETGGVFINGSSASDPRTPIGGVKLSGYGRELSYFGIREFTNAQIVWADR